jgi:hypothetical protein
MVYIIYFEAALLRIRVSEQFREIYFQTCIDEWNTSAPAFSAFRQII